MKLLDVQNIERWYSYACLRVKQVPQPPFYFVALAPLPAEGTGLGSQSTRAGRIPAGLAALNKLHDHAAKQEVTAVIEEMVTLSNVDFAELVTRKVAANRYSTQELLAWADLVSDPVARALAISRAKYDLPWWFYESQ